MYSHDSDEERRQQAEAMVLQMLQFQTDIITTWCCGWFRPLQSSCDFTCCERGRKALVSCLLKQSSTLVANLTFEFFVMCCLCYVDKMSSDCTGADCQGAMSDFGCTPSRRISALVFRLEWVFKIYLWRQLFPAAPAGSVERLDKVVGYVWVTRLLILLGSHNTLRSSSEYR